jgi:hypothetical protein
MLNENAIANVLIDLDFLEEQFRSAGRANLASLFTDLRSVSVAQSVAAFLTLNHLSSAETSTQITSIVLSGSVADFLVPSRRQTTYANIKPKKLAALLDKLARHGATCRDQPSREKGERWRKEAEAVGRVFPGENR